MDQRAQLELSGFDPEPEPSPPLEPAFERAFRRLGLKRSAPIFRATFHPFAGLRSAIRLRGDLITARVADVLRPAPPLVLDAVAEILVARLFGRTPSREARAVYLRYVLSPSVRPGIDSTRRRRARPRWRSPQGRFFDLQVIFARLNRRYFQGKIRVLGLGWSARASRTILGHFDPGLETITINSRLDSPHVPRFVVEYLMFHEMLHTEFPVRPNGHRRLIHSREFRNAERQFPEYRRAVRWLKVHSIAGAR
jgi:hypothetical protein